MTARRPAAVAGLFYPADPDRLRRQVAGLLGSDPGAPAIATLAPHAGYDYSGGVAGAVYGSVALPTEVLVVSFNHSGIGEPVAVWPEGAWSTPLGDAPESEDLRDGLLRLPGASADSGAFAREHSGEVQLPFLLVRRPDVRFAHLSVQTHDPRRLRALAESLAALMAPRGALLVATTDLTHCGEGYDVAIPKGETPAAHARRLDAEVLGPIERLDVDGFWSALARHRVPMCGIAPTAVFLSYSRARGARAARIVRYETSADREPDADRAVGYPGVVVTLSNP